ncbi:hypothetical protein FOA43_000691 [Brettanomyces nanus]|uniref:Uncharacterized protein n=1 Tax=Eeniella nana TaxID=13502 RepID=A0A875RW54_EENNA|nr:uncharacterized protein FOA43_000691 [Brettanomyces nanus]QPG73381.1 hypothetical protein FOA43_000691 [Brettanomyces nanus]
MPISSNPFSVVSVPKPSKFFNRSVSFDDYQPEIIEPAEFLNIHPPPYSSSGPNAHNGDRCLSENHPHLKSILKRTSVQPVRTSAQKLYEIPGTGISKSLLDMTDQEILLLDSQFSKRHVDVEKNYRFDSDPRLSPVGNPFAAKKVSNSAFNFLNMTDYPTKPIIKKNSICLNFRHSKYTQEINSNKFYLILISKYKSSLSAIDFYLENYSKDGDNLVICASISNAFQESLVEQCILQLVDLILDKFVRFNKNLAVKVNFEFFRNINYMGETLNLYQPSLIIVGSKSPGNKYTSITTTTKSFVPLVYVGTNYSESLTARNVSFRKPRFYRSASPAATDINTPSSPDLRSPRNLSPIKPSHNESDQGEYDSSSDSEISSLESVEQGGAEESKQRQNLEDEKNVNFENSSPKLSEESSERKSKPPAFLFLNAVPHLNHLSRAERELQPRPPIISGQKSSSAPLLGVSDLMRIKSNPATIVTTTTPSVTTSSTHKAIPKLIRTSTVPAVITPELLEKHAMFERYNRRMSSMKVNPYHGSDYNKSEFDFSESLSPSRSDSGDNRINSSDKKKNPLLGLPRSRSKINLSELDTLSPNSSSSSSASTVSERRSSSPVGFLRKFWKHK